MIRISALCEAQCPPPDTLRQTLASASPSIRVTGAGALEDTYRLQFARPRGAAAFAVVFAVVTLVAAACGIFGLFNQCVLRRRRELGIRAALGAQPTQLSMLVYREGLWVTAIGLAGGLGGAMWLSTVLRDLLYETAPLDPLVWLAVFTILATSGLAATWRPTSAAARVDPADLLKNY